MFLDKKITRLVLQFFVDSLNQIPDVLMNEERPCPTERPRRTNDGELTINHQRNCSAENFIFELESAGYMLVDVNWQKRRRAEKPYYVIRCFFLKREKVRPSRRLEIVGGLFRPAVLQMLTSAKWEIWSYQYPGSININLGDRNTSDKRPDSFLYIMNRTIQVEIC